MSKLIKAAAAIGMVAATTQLAMADAGSQCCPFSDRSLKTQVQPLEKSTQQLLQLNGVEFTWKESGRKDVGLVAQNVRDVYPQLVHEKEGLLTVDYQKLVAPLVESVRELNARIEVLENAQAD